MRTVNPLNRLTPLNLFNGESGQAFVEYTMIVGLLTAIIIALTKIIVPGVGAVVSGLVQHIAVYVSSI